MTIADLKAKKCILFECISGSQAYGLADGNSDIDIKGVYILPKENFYSLEYVDQINENNNNIAFYELRKFIDLLAKNNPNMLEMLNTPDDCVLYKHPLYNEIKQEYFLSQLCKATFAGYAMTQLKKARGLNKKILNPMDKQKKTILDFCYVVSGQGSIPARQFLKQENINPSDCGLAAVPHMREVYGLYVSEEKKYSGLFQGENSNDVTLSSIEENKKPIAILSFNKDGYSKYCKDYKEYFEWEENRNDARYQNTITHGKNYDAKNMMHTFRLLHMAKEIGESGVINVRRCDRDFLLSIKNGHFEYEELVKNAEIMVANIEGIYSNSKLPKYPDLEKINTLLVNIRDEFYK